MTRPSTAAPNRSRKWLQFSLRTFLLAITLCGIWLGFRLYLARTQHAAVKAIQAAGGDVEYQNVKRPFVDNRYPPKLSWLDTQLGIDFFHDVEQVQLSGPAADNELLEKVGALSGVRQLWISNHPQITDEGMKHVKGLHNLESVGLLSTEITDAGILHLSSLPKIKTLDLAGSPITDRGLEHLAKLQSLESLHLMGAEISDAGMEHVARLSSLRELQLHETSVTDAGIGRLADLPNLEALKLPEAFTDDGVKYLVKMKKLKVVFAAKSRLSAAAQAEVTTAIPGISLH